MPYFKIALVNIDNDIEIVGAAIHSGKQIAEYIFQNAHHCWAVDVFLIP